MRDQRIVRNQKTDEGRRRINSPPNRPTKIHLCLGLSVHRSIGRLLSFVGTCEKLNGQRVKIREWGEKRSKGYALLCTRRHQARVRNTF